MTNVVIVAVLAQAALAFGGIPFGAPEEEVRQTIGANLTEETLADGSKALVTTERVAGRDAERKWIIREHKFAEGILLFHFKSDEAACRSLQQTALSSIESNYGSRPRLDTRSDTGPTGIQSELWVITLEHGARIEQRMSYVPLISLCTVSGRYFPPPDRSSAF